MSSSSSDTLFQLRQSAILLLTAMIWGATFVAQSLGMDSVGPFTFTTTRMLLGAFFLLPIVLLRRKRLAAEKPAEAARRSAPQYRRTLLMGGILCGLCLFGGESLQQFGFVHDTEVGKSGFITALYIVFVPIISLFLGRRGQSAPLGCCRAFTGRLVVSLHSAGRLHDCSGRPLCTCLCGGLFAPHSRHWTIRFAWSTQSNSQ